VQERVDLDVLVVATFALFAVFLEGGEAVNQIDKVVRALARHGRGTQRDAGKLLRRKSPGRNPLWAWQ
jgi:hypothetical protein